MACSAQALWERGATFTELCDAYERLKICYTIARGTALMSTGYNGRHKPFTFMGINTDLKIIELTKNIDNTTTLNATKALVVTENSIMPQQTMAAARYHYR